MPQSLEKLAGPVNFGRTLIRISTVGYVAFLFALASVAIGLAVAQNGAAAGMFDYYDSAEEISER
eukprot:SAG31_NODE_39648_length_286_cov_1.385027_1_plen_65_part_00